MEIDELDPNGVPGADGVSEDDALLETEEAEIASPSLDQFARERGWKPKEEWNGEGEWRDAATFLSFGLDKGRDASRDLKELRDTTSRIADTQARIMQQEVERAREDERAKWTANHRQAVEEGDFTAATQAADNLAKLQQAPQQQGPNPEVQRWVAENPWFQTDPMAASLANAEATRLAQLGKGVAEQLESARAVVHKRFPEYAPTPAPSAKVIEVAQPGVVARRTTGGKSFSDMPAQAQQAARIMVARGGATTLEGYARQYFNTSGEVE